VTAATPATAAAIDLASMREPNIFLTAQLKLLDVGIAIGCNSLYDCRVTASALKTRFLSGRNVTMRVAAHAVKKHAHRWRNVLAKAKATARRSYPSRFAAPVAAPGAAEAGCGPQRTHRCPIILHRRMAGRPVMNVPCVRNSARSAAMIRRYTCPLALLLAALPLTAPAQGFDRTGWIADFEQLKAEITQRSPNLEWQAQRGLDLGAMEAHARARLAAANDDSAARSALERFVKSFGDGHMQLSWPSAAAPASSTAPAPRSVCSELGYQHDEDDTYAIAPRLPGYQSLRPAGGSIEAGFAPVGRRQIGVVRIAMFQPGAAMCELAVRDLSIATDSPCDETCSNRISQRADDVFLAEIEARVRDIEARHPAALLVDVASNGGGNDTSISIARMLTAATLTTPPLAVVKSADRLAAIDEDKAVLEAGLAHASPSESAFLRDLIDQLARAHAQGTEPCDLSPLWSGREAGCTLLIRGPFYAGGMIPGEVTNESADEPWAEYVSATAHHHYTHGLWRGRLMVLVDGNSASSTELFAAMLQDAGAATIVGAPTFGAGCGWNLPHESVVLAHSGGMLDIPNCARFRRDGRNEIDGVQPDVLIGFRTYDSARQRVDRLGGKLAEALDRKR